MKTRRQVKGSFTVEAALLTSVFLLVIFAVIYLFLFVYNRAWYTAAAQEAVVTAVTEGTGEDGNAAGVLSNKIQNIQSLGGIGCTVTVTENVSKEQVKTSFYGEMPWAYGSYCMKFTAQGECDVIKPVFYIRKVRCAGQLLETGKGIAGYE